MKHMHRDAASLAKGQAATATSDAQEQTPAHE